MEHFEYCVDLVGIDYIVFNFKKIDKKIMDVMHKRDVKVFVYTVNKKQDIERIKALKVDGVISDYPDRI